MQHKSYILLTTGYRVTISWNDAARQCEQIGAHLPFFKRYGPDTLQHRTQMQQYAELQLREWDRAIGLGDITFIGVMRKVINQSINHGLHIHQGLWRPWTTTDHDLVPFEPQ